MSNSYFNPPTPAYNNPEIESENFSPSRFVISAISRGSTTTVTTSTAHNYVIGQLVRLLIPVYYGSQQLNQQTAYVTALPSTTQVTLDLFSVGCDAFIPSPTFGPTSPQIVAIGDRNSGLVSTTGRSMSSTTIAGSFQNISP